MNAPQSVPELAVVPDDLMALDDTRFKAVMFDMSIEEVQQHPQRSQITARYHKLTSYMDGADKRLPHNGADVLETSRRREVLNAAPRKSYAHTWIDDTPILEGLDYCIKALIERRRFVVVYGATGSGKSTLTIDMGLHIAAELRWRGRRVKGAPVVYFAAEAGASINPRVVAARDYLLGEARETRIPFAVIPTGPDLRNRVDVERMIDAIQAIAAEIGAGIALIIIDTLSRAAPGADENSPADMSEIVGACDRIREATGAAVLLVHHSGKDSARGARGHSALAAAADTIIEVADGVATIEKSRDGVSGEKFAFALDPVHLGDDADGDPITACVVRHLTEQTTKAKPVRLTGVARVALQALTEAIGSDGQVLPGTSTIPAGVRAVTIDRWRSQFKVRYGDADRGTDALKKAFQRAREQLAAVDAVAVSDPYAWVTR